MSDPSRAHRLAIETMLAPLAETPTSYQIYSNKVTVSDADLTFPYLVVRGAPGRRDIINFNGQFSSVTTSTQVMAIGRDEDEVEAALDRAAALLHGLRPTVTGRDCDLIRQEGDVPYIVPSPDVHTPDGQDCYQGAYQFTFGSTPTT